MRLSAAAVPYPIARAMSALSANVGSNASSPRFAVQGAHGAARRFKRGAPRPANRADHRQRPRTRRRARSRSGRASGTKPSTRYGLFACAVLEGRALGKPEPRGGLWAWILSGPPITWLRKARTAPHAPSPRSPISP